MEFQIKKKLEATDKLPEYQQAVITLTTQREIDQLYALLSFVPVLEAFGAAEGDEVWRALRGFLQPRNHAFWHNRLANLCSKKPICN